MASKYEKLVFAFLSAVVANVYPMALGYVLFFNSYILTSFLMTWLVIDMFTFPAVFSIVMWLQVKSETSKID